MMGACQKDMVLENLCVICKIYQIKNENELIKQMWQNVKCEGHKIFCAILLTFL